MFFFNPAGIFNGDRHLRSNRLRLVDSAAAGARHVDLLERNDVRFAFRNHRSDPRRVERDGRRLRRPSERSDSPPAVPASPLPVDERGGY